MINLAELHRILFLDIIPLVLVESSFDRVYVSGVNLSKFICWGSQTFSGYWGEGEGRMRVY